VSPNFWLLAILAVIVAVGVLVVRWQLHKRKVEAFRAFARQRGWLYQERDDGLTERYLGTPFGEGFGKQARHVLSGVHRERTFVAFEYVYKVSEGSGKNQRIETHHHTVVALSTPAARPTLQVTREGLGRKLLGLIGVRDLQLESEKFNDTFLLRTDDDKFAYDILHPRTMEWMLTDPRAVEIPFRFERADLLAWQPGVIDLNTALWLLEYLCDVLDRVPSFVWKP
jgi:hypothetical protein